MGCEQPQMTFLRQTVPDQLLQPCQISDRQVKTVNELAVLATEHLRAAECANGKISAIAEIVQQAPGQGAAQP